MIGSLDFRVRRSRSATRRTTQTCPLQWLAGPSFVNSTSPPERFVASPKSSVYRIDACHQIPPHERQEAVRRRRTLAQLRMTRCDGKYVWFTAGLCKSRSTHALSPHGWSSSIALLGVALAFRGLDLTWLPHGSHMPYLLSKGWLKLSSVPKSHSNCSSWFLGSMLCFHPPSGCITPHHSTSGGSFRTELYRISETP